MAWTGAEPVSGSGRCSLTPREWCVWGLRPTGYVPRIPNGRPPHRRSCSQTDHVLPCSAGRGNLNTVEFKESTVPQANGQPDGVGQGVDRSLIRWMLSLSAEQRLAWLCNVIRTVEEMQRGRPR